MGTLLYYLGAIVMLVGGIWIIVLAFQKSIWWGLGSLFVPFVALIFAIMHWAVAQKPFFIWLAGLAIAVVGALLGGMPTAELPSP